MRNTVRGVKQLRDLIRLELRRLDEKEDELTRKSEELKTYINYLEELADELRHVKSERQLKDIITRGELETRVMPDLFRMSKYFAEKGLEKKLSSARIELKETLQEVWTTRRRKENADVCPRCNGQGKLRNTRYIREDGIVRPILEVTDCALCEGKGKIELANPFHSSHKSK